MFSKAWTPFRALFKQPFKFCGAFSTIFPGTFTVESDFSVLQWEIDLHRSMLTDHMFEGIIHYKQISIVRKWRRGAKMFC